MRDGEILLHHLTGAADLVSDLGAELGRQQVVQHLLNTIAFSFGCRREFPGKRLERNAVPTGRSDGFGSRARRGHLSRAFTGPTARHPSLKQSALPRVPSDGPGSNNKMTARGGQILLVPI